MKLKLKQKFSIYIGLAIFSISLSAALFFYFRYTNEIQSHIDNRLTFGAMSVEQSIDFSRINELFLPEAQSAEYYNKSHEALSAIKKIFGLKYLYVNVVKDGKYIFVLDTANIKTEKDYSADAETFLIEYEEFPEALDLAFKTGTIQLTREVYTDQWGTYLSAYYPVKDKSGNLIAVIGADYDVANVIKDKQKASIALIFILIAIVAVTAAVMLMMNRMLFNPLFEFISKMKKAAEELDLSTRFETDRKDEIGELSSAFNLFVDKLQSLVKNVVISMQELVNSTADIAAGNESLAQRTSEQAAALEEIASTVEQAAGSIINGAENSYKARDLSGEASTSAKDGNDVIERAITAINKINETSEKITQITSVINEIAFQTNLLALNASVEAARAGEKGRGFAVVAGEVRNLAQRAGGAAKEIDILIKDSVEKIREGSRLVKTSGDSLVVINSSVNAVSVMINEIAAMNEEQKTGMGEINKAVSELDSMTQANSALVEETASASNEIHTRSQELLAMVAKFKI